MDAQTILLLVSLLKLTSAFLNDKKDDESPFLKETPIVDCQIQRFSFQVETKEPFSGRLFVKGHSNEKQCSIDFSIPQFGGRFNDTRRPRIDVDFNTCGMERIRSLSPRGVTYTNTITVQFHRMFITQGDKTFKVRCFYAEQQKTIMSEFDVSNMPTHYIEHDMQLPSCSYSIRADTLNGPVVHAPKVGDLVYHRWECTRNMQIYGMLVHSCLIENESGGRHTLMVDPLGCAASPDIVPNLIYNDDLNLAYTSSKAFKYPDDPIVKFHCQITICLKMDNGCKGLTPPSCETSRKIKRSIFDLASAGNGSSSESPQDLFSTFANLDVIARDIFVLDESEQQSFDQQHIGEDNEEESSTSDDSFAPSGLMPHKSGRQSSYTSFYDGLPSISPSPAPTSSSEHRRSTLRRGTDTTGVDGDTVTFTSEVHSSIWDLYMNRFILIAILCAFVLFFVGAISFVVYVKCGRNQAEIEQPFASDPSLSTVLTITDSIPHIFFNGSQEKH